jgi:hypothetical protein
MWQTVVWYGPKGGRRTQHPVGCGSCGFDSRPGTMPGVRRLSSGPEPSLCGRCDGLSRSPGVRWAWRRPAIRAREGACSAWCWAPGGLARHSAGVVRGRRTSPAAYRIARADSGSTRLSQTGGGTADAPSRTSPGGFSLDRMTACSRRYSLCSQRSEARLGT